MTTNDNPRSAHLTGIPANAKLLAWHSTDQFAAVQVDGHEKLLVNGKLYILPAGFHHPTQMVINYCHLTRQEKRKFLANLVKGLE